MTAAYARRMRALVEGSLDMVTVLRLLASRGADRADLQLTR
jgi:hypothetical protein